MTTEGRRRGGHLDSPDEEEKGRSLGQVPGAEKIQEAVEAVGLCLGHLSAG